MPLRKCADEGVRELQRLENCVGGREKEAVRARSWASTRATRRLDVTGLEPIVFKMLGPSSLLQMHVPFLTESCQQAEPGWTTSNTDNIVYIWRSGGIGPSRLPLQLVGAASAHKTRASCQSSHGRHLSVLALAP